MKFSVLASGSKANCTYIESGSTRILIDCGLSAKEAAGRLRTIGVDVERIDAILVTHEHRDHVAGIPVLSRRWEIPVYATRAASAALEIETTPFAAGGPFEIGDLRIEPFSIPHDAGDPVGFAVFGSGMKLVCVTDLGRVTTLVRAACLDANALILEFNHDLMLLKGCGYPWVLKQRIASAHGHLSNEDAAGLVAEVLQKELAHLVLGHISENSNTPDTALAALAARVDVNFFASCRCASPYRATPLTSTVRAGRCAA